MPGSKPTITVEDLSFVVLPGQNIFAMNGIFPFRSFLFFLEDANRHKETMTQTLALPAPFSRPDTLGCCSTAPVKWVLESGLARQTWPRSVPRRIPHSPKLLCLRGSRFKTGIGRRRKELNTSLLVWVEAYRLVWTELNTSGPDIAVFGYWTTKKSSTRLFSWEKQKSGFESTSTL